MMRFIFIIVYFVAFHTQASIVLNSASGEITNSIALLGDEIYLLHRFEIDEASSLSQIGGFFLGGDGVDVFAAIVSLDSEGDFPDSNNLSTPDVVFSTLITISGPAQLYTKDISVPTAPGWYALVFGTGNFGAPSRGRWGHGMPVLETDAVVEQAPIYFNPFWNNQYQIVDEPLQFYVATIPLPTSLYMFISALGAVGFFKNHITSCGTPPTALARTR